MKGSLKITESSKKHHQYFSVVNNYSSCFAGWNWVTPVIEFLYKFHLVLTVLICLLTLYSLLFPLNPPCLFYHLASQVSLNFPHILGVVFQKWWTIWFYCFFHLSIWSHSCSNNVSLPSRLPRSRFLSQPSCLLWSLQYRGSGSLQHKICLKKLLLSCITDNSSLVVSEFLPLL